MAKNTLNAFVSNCNIYGIMAAVYGFAIEHYLHPMQVYIVGSKQEKLTLKYFNESLKAYYPLKIVDILDPEKNKWKLKKLRYPILDSATAYVCFDGSCKSVRKPANIGKVIRGKNNAK